MAQTAQPSFEKILVIEPSGALGERIRDSLMEEGYRVTLVKEPLQGLKAIYDSLPHLIILDVDLPGADAYDILARKQSEKMLAKIPVLLIANGSVPIHMNRIPKDCVTEFVASLDMPLGDIVQRVNRRFAHSAQAPAAFAGQNAKKILWVEDDKLIGTILSKKLTASGFELIHCKNGEEALETLRSVLPDVIVLDLVLPGMSGFDILQEIKKDSALARVPVMILSNLSKTSDIERATSLGAQKFLVKASVSLDEIVEEMRSMCK